MKSIEPMEWTDERYIPEIQGDVAVMHWHRYKLAVGLAVGTTVLDIASGEGYGSALLAKSAAHVIGVDLAADAIEHAKSKYTAANLEFKLGTCTNIPLDDKSVNLIVSFETIEHHDQHEAMMAEFTRVLKKDGVLFISSPDNLEKFNYKDPWHVKELYCDEFKLLVRRYFKNVNIFRQRVIHGSAIFQEGVPSPTTIYGSVDDQQNSFFAEKNWFTSIAIASNSSIPPMAGTILERRLHPEAMAVDYNRLNEKFFREHPSSHVIGSIK